MIPPGAFMFLGEFVKTVFEELGAALRRRRKRRADAEEDRKRKEERLRQAELEQLEYEKHLAKLKSTSKIPENQYE